MVQEQYTPGQEWYRSSVLQVRNGTGAVYSRSGMVQEQYTPGQEWYRGSVLQDRDCLGMIQIRNRRKVFQYMNGLGVVNSMSGIAYRWCSPGRSSVLRVCNSLGARSGMFMMSSRPSMV
jgi:hypothetical protein